MWLGTRHDVRMVTPSAEDIAKRAQELKVVFLALQISSVAIVHPALPLMQFLRSALRAEATADIPFVLPDQARRTEMVFSAREVFMKASALQGDVLKDDLMAIGMVLAAVRLGDMILKGNHHDPNHPLLEFAKHFRNACAHGDRWNFTGGAPPRVATCREMTLTAGHHGQRATLETVGPRLFVEYLDDLSNHFVPGCVPPAATEVR